MNPQYDIDDRLHFISHLVMTVLIHLLLHLLATYTLSTIGEYFLTPTLLLFFNCYPR